MHIDKYLQIVGNRTSSLSANGQPYEMSDTDPNRLSMEQFPMTVLENIAAYLSKVPRVLFAVALTAPSSSWERCGGKIKKAHSRASEIIMAGPYYRAGNNNVLNVLKPKLMTIDKTLASKYNLGCDAIGRLMVCFAMVKYEEYEEKWDSLAFDDKTLAAKLTDGDICGILLMINANKNLCELTLTHCVKLIGHGLSPLCGSDTLERINLSPTMFEEAVVPILQSIVDIEGSFVLDIELPKLWKVCQSEVLTRFLEGYNQACNKLNVECFNCNNLCIGTDKSPWISWRGKHYGLQNKSCWYCCKSFCRECERDILRCCASCEKKFCTGCEREICDSCDSVACNGCSPFDYCKCCERTLCGGCTPYIQCSTCGEKANCIDCAENFVGDVQQCVHCGVAFCSSCRAMEKCFKSFGSVCNQCHDQLHDNVIDCYWQVIPPQLKQIVHEFGAEQLLLANHYWEQCSSFICSDKFFDMQLYHTTLQIKAAAYIISADYLLKGQCKEAVYMILYAALIDEIPERGPDYIKKFFKTVPKPIELNLCTNFGNFCNALAQTSTRENIVEFLSNKVSQQHCGARRLSDMVLQLSLQQLPLSLHYSWLLDEYKEEDELRDSCRMNVITSNLDDGTKQSFSVYKNMTLSWLLRWYAIGCKYSDWARHPKESVTAKYFRVLHKERTLFLSSSGKKTLEDLGIQDGDLIAVGGVDSGEKKGAHTANAATVKCGTKKKMKSGRAKKKSKPTQASPLSEEQLMEKYRQEHSKAMIPVFEALGPLLKGIRNRLNDLSIHKSAPKIRVRRKSVSGSLRGSQLGAADLPPWDDGLGGKAGRIAYPVLVGEVSNLYKTSKSSGIAPITIDLHGRTGDEALQTLDSSLPLWVETAMRGEYPFVIPVDIICGGGNQILSELVRNWIRTNRTVANRPKGR